MMDEQWPESSARGGGPVGIEIHPKRNPKVPITTIDLPFARRWPALGIVLASWIGGSGVGAAPADDPVDFARDIRPILNRHCSQCHNAETGKGGLVLSDAGSALAPTDAKAPAIVPGLADESELIFRVESEEDLDRMPPTRNRLSDEQVRLLRVWIDQGADWPDLEAPTHWAYVPPERPALPTVGTVDWPSNPIDHFILARLESEGLAPAPEVDRARLIRRVSLDLTGLPPSIEEVDAFLADDRPDAYERLVDRLLASPHYGERWARPWLDLARHADSNGFQRDGFRDVWPYRDWVVNALNADLPFDRFTVEQIAGDLLPDASLDQKIATGFHRGPTVNVEAGVDQEENRVHGVVDRVNTTATVWLGSTLACAQCHDHKYDPFSTEEYYRLFAYFNQTEVETKFRSEDDTAAIDFRGPYLAVPLPPEDRARRRSLRREQVALAEQCESLMEAARPLLTDWETALLADEEPLQSLAAPIRSILKTPAEERSDEDRQQLAEALLRHRDPSFRKARQSLTELERRLEDLEPPKALVMVERAEPRPTFVLNRGDFLDPGAPVEPDVPEVLHPLPADAPPDRLGLARWLGDPSNPLVARVTVNRWWLEIFGRGIVTTPEDFGTQGEPPSHPDLLDWLAVEFVESGWSAKHVHRLIVTSSTYRQSSRITPDLLKRDPDNALLARGPRFRLPAEAIRDNALAISGLLSPALGGPPVFPPQPEGIWRVTGLVDNTYRTSTGPDRHRRGLYTIWRRSAPYPTFVVFDAPERSGCVVERARTNTPLQALALLNDPAFVEIAAALASRILRDCPNDDLGARLEHAFRLVLARSPGSEELAVLADLHRQELQRYEADPDAARKLSRGQDLAGTTDQEWAAWFSVANLLLNLDEAITKP
ncbi:DUF1553 domain-containing protein [soil metagenome]